MSQATMWFPTRVYGEVAKDFLDGSTVLDARTNWDNDNRIYQLDANGSVYLPNYCGVQRLDISEFVGGVAYSLAEQGIIPQEAASPNHIANVCFELGKLVGQNEAEIDSVDPFSLSSQRLFVEA
jgi:hypothetical protein